MATMQDVLDQLARVRDGVNALEAKVTAALAKLPAIPADVQAQIDQAFAEAKGAADDAADGVDEAAPPTP